VITLMTLGAVWILSLTTIFDAKPEMKNMSAIPQSMISIDHRSSRIGTSPHGGAPIRLNILIILSIVRLNVFNETDSPHSLVSEIVYTTLILDLIGNL
jgi:hypothetical protein